MTHRNFRRLTVYVNNIEKKPDVKFKNVFTYNNVQNELEAINLVWTMHSNLTDNAHDMSRKIQKATYNGKPLAIFSHDRPSKLEFIVKNA
jgi:hypothetical protein